MSLERQLLFLFSALGALNGIFLSVYFLFFTKTKKHSNYFLSALLLVVSIRVIKSVFFYFNPNLSQLFIQVGLSACALVGPLLYLYVKNIYKEKIDYSWMWHIIPVSLIVISLSVIYPYWEFRKIWTIYIIDSIYLLWFIYVIVSGFTLRNTFKKIFNKNEKFSKIDFWVISVFVGVTLILIGYRVGSFTSYIVGAVSSSFVFYLILLFLFLKRSNPNVFIEEKVKYADKKIADKDVNELQDRLDNLIREQELFKNSNLKLKDVSRELHLTSHYVSQFLNDNLGKSFSSYINEYRIDYAKKMLSTNSTFTIEAIGYESGFNSKSTFFTTFKKYTGVTPSKYRELES